MKSKERFDKKHFLLAVFFERPNESQVKKDKRYNYIIFNHVGFHMPYFGSIYENVGDGLGVPQESSDIYLPPNHIKIILPIKLDKNIKKIMEKNVDQYGYCVPFVINVLKDLKILPKSTKYKGVDDLFFALKKYRFNVDDVKKFNKI